MSITNDSQLMTAQARVQVIQSVLAHNRATLTPASFRAQAKSWLKEWERLEHDIREYLSSPADAKPKAHKRKAA